MKEHWRYAIPKIKGSRFSMFSNNINAALKALRPMIWHFLNGRGMKSNKGSIRLTEVSEMSFQGCTGEAHHANGDPRLADFCGRLTPCCTEQIFGSAGFCCGCGQTHTQYYKGNPFRENRIFMGHRRKRDLSFPSGDHFYRSECLRSATRAKNRRSPLRGSMRYRKKRC